MACRYTYKGKTYQASEFMRLLSDLTPSEASAFMPGVNSVPDAPLIGKTESWSMLAMKRMVRYAADNGFDKIAWTTGAQQNERYDLSKQVNMVSIHPERTEGKWVVFIEGKDGQALFNGTNGFSFQGQKVVTADELENLVGKDVAKNLIEGSAALNKGKSYADSKWYDSKPADLKIGGKGMKGFYDEILPSEVNKFAKRFGGKVGETTLPKFAGSKPPNSMDDGELLGALNEPNGGYSVHSLDITDSMRDTAREGLPLFSKPDTESTKDNIVISDKAKESVASVLKRLGSGKLTDLKPALLGSIPLNYLVDFAPQGMPSVKQFIELRQQLETFRNTQHQKYDAIAQRWLKYSTVQGLKGIFGKSSEQGRILADFQNDSTVAGVDASQEYKPLEFTAEFRKRNEKGTLEIVQKKIPVTEAAIKNQIRIVQMNMKRAEGIAAEKSKGKNEATKKKYDRALASRLDTLNEKINQLDKLLRDENKRAADYPDLLKRYEALPQEGKELFALSRDAYKEQSDMVEQALIDNFDKARDYRKTQVEREYADRIKDINEDSDLSPEEAEVEKIRAGEKHKAGIKAADQSSAAKVIALRQKFESMKVQEPYFPLKRFGRYSIAVKKDGKTVGFMKRKNFAEAEALAKEMGEKGYTANIFLDTEKDAQRNAIDPRFIADLDEILDSSGVSDDVRDSIYQRYLETLPDLSLRKNFIHRKKTPGYDADTLRAFSSTMFHGSYQLARLKYGLDLKEAHNVSVDQAKRVSPVQGMALANELGKRLAWIMNPSGSSTAQALTSAAFFWHLGANPAHLFLNATQTVMLGIPILGSKFGLTNTTKELAKATKDFATGKGHIEKADLKPDELAAMEAFYKMGLSDKTQSHDLAGVGETGAEYSAVRQRAMAKIGWFFHQSERFNREVTALAAYRLARDSGMTHEQAIKSAAENTWAIHFDYSSAARPRYLQGDTAKVLFVFRNYNINMLYRLFRDMHDAFRGETPQVRKEAAKQLGAMMGMYGLMAGLTGVPFYGLLVALAGLFDDKDDPFDAETRMKQGLVEFLGEDAAGVLLKGAPGSALGVDLSQRIGMPNLWFRSPDRELEGRDAYYYWMEQILGATPGIAKNVFTGLQQIHEGKVERGVETMLPNMAKSPLKAARYAWDGKASNLDGDQIAETGFTDIAKQALGFTPGSVSDQYEKTGALKSADAKLLKRRQDIVSDYANAARENDSAGKMEAMDALRKFNMKNPAYKITMDTLRKSLKTRAKNDQLNEGGIVLNKRLRALRDSVD